MLPSPLLGPPRAGQQSGLRTDIRPAILLPVAATRKLLTGLANNGVRRGGVWDVMPGQWHRYDRPWSLAGRGDAVLLGTVHCVYDEPTRYMTTLYRAVLTEAGLAEGWTADALCQDVLWHGGLSLEDCSRADLPSAPRTYTEPAVHLR